MLGCNNYLNEMGFYKKSKLFIRKTRSFVNNHFVKIGML